VMTPVVEHFPLDQVLRKVSTQPSREASCG
jgi:hypothetical protein